jgi:hypothetical protein
MYTGTSSRSFTIFSYSVGMDNVYEEGDTLLSGDYIYMITDDENNEVELSGISNKKLTKVVIPGTVKDENGITYKVPSKLVKKYKKEFDSKSGFKNTMKIKKK